MSISLVQKNASGGPGIQTVSISPSMAGNFITVFLFNQSTTYTVFDNLGNNYIQIVSQLAGSNPDSCFILTLENCPAGITSISCNFPVAGTISVIEWSGVVTSGALDSVAQVVGTSVPPIGPSMTTTLSEELIVTQISCNFTLSGVDAPWIFDSITDGIAYVIASPGTYQAIFNPTSDNNFTTVAASFFSAGSVTLALSLSDSVTISDSPIIPSFDLSQSLSDSIGVSDSVPQSFSIQSDFIAPIHVPVVEQLVNQLVPAHVKTYFRIEE